jgi:hypothetical protein
MGKKTWKRGSRDLVISRRFPGWQAVTSVYAIIVLFVYGWTIYWILWELPSWIFYLTVSEILLVFSYSMVVNLLESLAFIFGVLILSILLPGAWFRDRFSSAGSLLSMLFGVTLIHFSGQIQAADNFSYAPLIQMGIFFIGAICIAILLSRFQPVAAFLDLLSDRAKIFLYISLPVSIVSLIVVIFRNLVL